MTSEIDDDDGVLDGPYGSGPSLAQRTPWCFRVAFVAFGVYSELREPWWWMSQSLRSRRDAAIARASLRLDRNGRGPVRIAKVNRRQAIFGHNFAFAATRLNVPDRVP